MGLNNPSKSVDVGCEIYLLHYRDFEVVQSVQIVFLFDCEEGLSDCLSVVDRVPEVRGGETLLIAKCLERLGESCSVAEVHSLTLEFSCSFFCLVSFRGPSIVNPCMLAWG